MKKLIVILVLCFGLFVACSEEQIDEVGKGIVKGRVVNKVSFEPIANAKISSSPVTSTVFTDDEGYFVVNDVPTGEYSFQAQKEGFLAKFEPANVSLNSTSQIVFELSVSSVNNKAPEVPSLTLPIDNATNQPITTKLTWTATDIDKDPLTYTVTLKNATTDAVTTFADLKTASLDLTNLSYNTKYFWQVIVSDGINKPVNSVTFSFTTLPFPDGRYLFVEKVNSNNVIFTANDSGGKLQISSSTSNCYRPRRNINSGKIAYISSDGSQNHIYTMNTDGSSIKKVTNTVPVAGFNMEHVGYSWNATGNQIIYPNFDKLYKINADGTGLTQIYQTPNGKFISECVWSNDGNSIVLKVNNNIGYEVEVYVISASGVVQYSVLSGISGAVSGLDMTVDNSKIVYTRDISGFQNLEYRRLDSRIFTFNTSTKVNTELISNKLAGFNDLDVRFSPNQAEVIYVNTSNDGISSKNIQKISLTNVESRVVLFSGASMPDWE